MLANSAAGLPACGPFEDWTAEGLGWLMDGARRVKVPSGRTLFRKGDAGNGCYLILAGAVKVTLPIARGQEMLLAILGSGEIVGETALLDRLPRSATVTALRPCELAHVSTAAFDRLAQTNIAIYRRLLCVMTTRMRASNEMHAVLHMPLRVRLATALLRLARQFGETLPGERVLIRQRISQVELGHMVGAARENVNRQLAEWRDAGILSRISAYYCLERLSAFELIARAD